MSKTYDLAIVGATGAVGEAMIEILAEREFPVGTLYPLASDKAAGGTVMFRGKAVRVQSLADFDFSRAQIGLFCAGSEVAAEYAPKAAAAGCVVIDTSACFRADDAVPLVIPEVNPEALAGYRERGIVASPAESTIPLLVALKPIYDAVGIERINVCTYQAVSSAGKKAIEALAGETAQLLGGQGIESRGKAFPKQIAFNCLPHIDEFESNGYTREEMQIVRETEKVLSDKLIRINPTCVRIPVFYSHSEAVHIETGEPITAEQAGVLLRDAPGVEVMDERCDGGYPTPVSESTGRDAVFVGRIREDISHGRGLNLWIVADNLRKGAALNSVQLAELLIKTYL